MLVTPKHFVKETCGEPSRRPFLRLEMDDLGLQVERLHNIVGKLVDKLADACRAEPSNPISETAINKEPQPHNVPLALNLRDMRQRMQEDITQLEELHRLLEV